ncbi:MAG: hypothetical protein PVI43_06400, partial [Candidatus Bathyarchaeota archaeon]
WVPEEPKMPKSKMKRYQVPLAVLVAATTILSLISSSAFFPNQTVVLAAPPLIVPNAPNSFFVELGGVVDNPEGFILVLSDGNHIYPNNLALKLTLTENSGDEFTVHLAVDCEGFSNEISVDGSIVNGDLVIDSERSLLLINPDVTKRQNVLLAKSNGWKVGGDVRSTASKTSTAIDPYRVTAIMVSSNARLTKKGWPLSLYVGYEPNTGLLVYSGMSLSDVLLEKLGIDYLYGSLKLVSYSENLNLEIATVSTSPHFLNARNVLFFVIVSALVIVPVVVVYAFRKTRKRRQAGAHNILELCDNIRQSCEVGD